MQLESNRTNSGLYTEQQYVKKTNTFHVLVMGCESLVWLTRLQTLKPRTVTIDYRAAGIVLQVVSLRSESSFSHASAGTQCLSWAP